MDTANLLVRQFVESHPRDAAQALEQLDIGEAVGIVKKLPSRGVGFASFLGFAVIFMPLLVR